MKINVDLSKTTRMMKLMIFMLLICSQFTHQKLKKTKKGEEYNKIEKSATLKLIKEEKTTKVIVEEALKEDQSVKNFVAFNLILYNIFLSLISLDKNYSEKSFKNFKYNSKHILDLLNLTHDNNIAIVNAFLGYKESFENISKDQNLKVISKKFLISKLKKFSQLKWSNELTDKIKMLDYNLHTISILKKDNNSTKFVHAFNTQMDDYRNIFATFAKELRPSIFPRIN